MTNHAQEVQSPESVRPELLPLPSRVRRLPVARGYPIPWFVAWIDGVPDFRVADGKKWRRAVKERRCWICGEALGVHLAFVIGPMCGINRTTTDPPSHLDCAEWSARACPFLSRPRARRREDEEIATIAAANPSPGVPLLRNPGVTLIWVTRAYRLFNDGAGRALIQIGPPERVSWYAEGREATREEVASSVESGLPALLELAEAQDRSEPSAGAVAELNRRARAFETSYPKGDASA